MQVLVAYGSRMGGTRGLADMVGREFERRGALVEVLPADEVDTIDRYDVVVVGAALYSLRWHKKARRFVRKQHRALRGKPVWLFSSGPLDDSAREQEIPPVRFVKKTIEAIGARGHMTFGGRLPEDAQGFPGSVMARSQAGDWRDPSHVREWVGRIVDELVRV